MLDPVWNKFVKEYDRALDPLGMNRLTDRLLNDLLLGITTVTPRARYYSFYLCYLWAIEQIITNGWAHTAAQFKTTFTDLERAFMLSCVAHEEQSGKENGRDHNDINGSSKGWDF